MALSITDESQPTTSIDSALPRPRPSTPAHVITSDAEAIRIATTLSAYFGTEAAARDRERRLPYAELDIFSQSGLWGITAPKRFGGADVSTVTVAEVFAILASADPSLAQIAQNHFCDVDLIRWSGSEAQQNLFLGDILRGARLGNALAEPGTNSTGQFRTRLTNRDGDLVLNGKKMYSTGSLLAHWVQVGATDDDGNDVLVLVPRDSPNLEIINDWSGFGQKTTASGTVVLNDIVVPPINVIPAYKAFVSPSTNGPFLQILHAALDLGMARAAIRDTIDFIKTKSRSTGDANVPQAWDDPFTITQVGTLSYRLHSAEALIERAAQLIDEAVQNPQFDTVAAASIAVAESKIGTTEIAIHAANKLFELAGTSSSLEKYALDRHWRNARTHTLHDPVRWKYHQIGNYYVNGIARHHAWH